MKIKESEKPVLAVAYKSLTCKSLSDVLRAHLSPISEQLYQGLGPHGDPDSSLHEYQVMPWEIQASP